MANLLLPTLTLHTISGFGFYSILLLIEKNGWGDMIRAALEEGILPNGEPLRTHYTGLGPLDTLLTTLVRFFYTVAVWERPPLSVFFAYFAGQIVPVHSVLVLEGLREGNKGTALF